MKRSNIDPNGPLPSSEQRFQPLSFDDLVSRAKAEETQLAEPRVTEMFRRLEPRLDAAAIPRDPALEAASQVGRAGNGARTTSPARYAALGAGAVGGLGLLAALFLQDGSKAQPSPASPSVAALEGEAPEDTLAPRGAAADGAKNSPDNAAENPPNDTAGNNTAANANDESPAGPGAEEPATPAPRIGVQAKRVTHVASRKVAAPSSATAATPEVAPRNPASASGGETSPAPAPKPSLDDSLRTLERAEQALRAGNPRSALALLAAPVVSPLTSRAQALRAVALCQSGQTAAGVALAQQHLAVNPTSPYEKRLTVACGRDL